MTSPFQTAWKGGTILSKKKIKDTDYLPISARIRAMENRLLNAERMERMIDAKSLPEAAKVLTECGYPELTSVTPSALEEALAKAQADLFQDLGSAVDNQALLDVFRCKTDYHNAKVLVKAEALGENQDRLLLGGGRYAPEALAENYRQEKLDAYSEQFRQSVARAREVLGATGDPQLADFVLDRASYAELTALAEASGSEFLRGYARLCVDVANLRSAVRAARLDKGPDFLGQALMEGGNIAVEKLIGARGSEIGGVFHGSVLAEAAELGASLSAPGSGPLTEFERLCDDAVMSYISQARYIPFGEQPVAAYLYARQAETTAIRIILSGRMAGVDGATIRQRLRRAYV